jgi:hypothetical protein
VTVTPPLTGGCLCRQVRFEIALPVSEALYCHCRMCRQAHGAPVVAWLTVPLAGFRVTAGAPAAYRSSARAFRHFCGTCGTPLTWREAENPTSVDVSIATLDDPAAVTPNFHLWTESRITWFDTADRLPRSPDDKRPEP